MKIKLFGKINTSKKDLNVLGLEDKINIWLEENPNIRIDKIEQSSNGGSLHHTKLFISIWYEEIN